MDDLKKENKSISKLCPNITLIVAISQESLIVYDNLKKS